ncbi:UNVERIFIED_CONTAM: hypothetical protein PYX00_000909 [Menopon gallinae]|uniref:Integrase catalytic domain-containing protein n=1 Tax=Menopon gallinae TaxID=328185 RepID=A0AAW2IC83_9NEOP
MVLVRTQHITSSSSTAQQQHTAYLIDFLSPPTPTPVASKSKPKEGKDINTAAESILKMPKKGERDFSALIDTGSQKRQKIKEYPPRMNITVAEEKPIYYPPRRLPWKEREIADQQVEVPVVIDASTKFVWLYPPKSTTSKEVIDKLEIQRKASGNLFQIITDAGAPFTSAGFKNYCQEPEIQHHLITTRLPNQGNRQSTDSAGHGGEPEDLQLTMTTVSKIQSWRNSCHQEDAIGTWTEDEISALVYLKNLQVQSYGKISAMSCSAGGNGLSSSPQTLSKYFDRWNDLYITTPMERPPYSAIRCLLELAIEEADRFPEAAEVLQKQTPPIACPAEKIRQQKSLHSEYLDKKAPHSSGTSGGIHLRHHGSSDRYEELPKDHRQRWHVRRQMQKIPAGAPKLSST